MLRSLMNGTFDIMSLLYRLPAILVSLSFHEWAHAYAAYKCGDPTARNLGRMTLNPLKHIDPIGFICLLLFRFGWAKPVPVNSRNYKNFKKGTILVSLAGITANFALAIISAVVLYFYAGSNYVIYNIILNFLFINISLMIFNLLPIPPLDGSHVLETLLIRKVGTKPFDFLHKYGYIILIVLMATGVIGTILQYVSSAILNGIFFVLNALFGGLF